MTQKFYCEYPKKNLTLDANGVKLYNLLFNETGKFIKPFHTGFRESNIVSLTPASKLRLICAAIQSGNIEYMLDMYEHFSSPSLLFRDAATGQTALELAGNDKRMKYVVNEIMRARAREVSAEVGSSEKNLVICAIEAIRDRFGYDADLESFDDAFEETMRHSL